jgi:hypothetical protein
MPNDAIPPFTCKISPTAVTIMDDFLDPPFSEAEIDRIDKMRDLNMPGRYNWALKEDIGALSPEMHRLYKKAVEVMGLDENEIVGIEFWINIFVPGEGIHMHADLDETLYRKTRRMECALAATMTFGEPRNLKGGSFVFEDGVTIRPRRNRCVLFFGGVRHGVEPVLEGERRAVLMSIWHRIPTAYKTHPGHAAQAM